MPYSKSLFVNPVSIQPNTIQTERENDSPKTNFANVLKSAINHVNKVDLEANVNIQRLTNDNVEDLHNVMIATQKASITIEAAVQVQQKVIDAYNEMMRMQV